MKIVLEFGEKKLSKGIFNVGTGGRSRSFNEAAQAVLATAGGGYIEYIEFPEDLRGRYQSRTQADLNRLRTAGVPLPTIDLENGVASTAKQGC